MSADVLNGHFEKASIMADFRVNMTERELSFCLVKESKVEQQLAWTSGNLTLYQGRVSSAEDRVSSARSEMYSARSDRQRAERNRRRTQASGTFGTFLATGAAFLFGTLLFGPAGGFAAGAAAAGIGTGVTVSEVSNARERERSAQSNLDYWERSLRESRYQLRYILNRIDLLEEAQVEIEDSLELVRDAHREIARVSVRIKRCAVVCRRTLSRSTFLSDLSHRRLPFVASVIKALNETVRSIRDEALTTIVNNARFQLATTDFSLDTKLAKLARASAWDNCGCTCPAYFEPNWGEIHPEQPKFLSEVKLYVLSNDQ